MKSKVSVKLTLLVFFTSQFQIIAYPLLAQDVSSPQIRIEIPDATSPSLTVRLIEAPAYRGMNRKQEQAISELVAANGDKFGVSKSVGDFDVGIDTDGHFLIVGPDGDLRRTLVNDRDLLAALSQFATQKAIEGGRWQHSRDSHLLQARLIPLKSLDPACSPAWLSPQWSITGALILAECTRWRAKVSLSTKSLRGFWVSGVLLEADGSIEPIPESKSPAFLKPGTSLEFEDVFQATQPFDVDETLVFLAATSEKGLLQTYTDASLMRVAMRIRVQRKLDFVEPASTTSSNTLREYTVSDFDITPYLPTQPGSRLLSVLLQADEMVKSARAGGIQYGHERWNPSKSDSDNLKLGIDCSRAIWFAFTKAGLKYSENGAKIDTEEMARSNSPMAKNFRECPSTASPKIGDLLVYRDLIKKDGHVVMVIDPTRRIAWGSHGWDGNERIPGLASKTGVEYQKIKTKTDWLRWDRPTMNLVACWRHKAFEVIQE